MSVHTTKLGQAGNTTLAVTVIVGRGAAWYLFERDEDTWDIVTLARGQADTHDEAVSDAAWWHARRCASYSETSDGAEIHADIMARVGRGEPA